MGDEVSVTQTHDVPTDINTLKTRLDELNTEKEKWFARKEELKLKIADLIQQVRATKAKNDDLSKNIKELKEKREEQNREVRRLITEIKGIQQKSSVITKNPDIVRKQIAMLETRIETGAISFNQEKKIMLEIKALKKEYDAAKKTDEANKGAREISKKIDVAKRSAEMFHTQMSVLAKENKESYKEFLRLSKAINTIKKEEEDAFAKFVAFKQEFSALNKNFKERMKKGIENKHFRKKEKEKMNKEKDMKKLEEKKGEVEEKIKKRTVLTTEDIIAFQGSDQV